MTLPHTDETDRALLRALRRGDQSAAGAFYARAAPVLLIHARTLLRDPALAEDAVQAAFCRVLSISKWRIARVESPMAWMVTVVRRQALMIARTNRRLLRRARESARRAPIPEPPSGSPEFDEITAAVHRLPRRLAEVVILRHVAALTFDQMGEALGVNRNTLAARYYAAMKRLRSALGAEQPEKTTEVPSAR